MVKKTSWQGTFLCLRIISARNLAAADSNGLSDPYCKVLVGEKTKFKTKVVPKSLNPTWNAMVVLPNPQGDVIVQIWDHDTLSHDDFLGFYTVSLDLSAVLPDLVVDRWNRLLPRLVTDSVSGDVRVIETVQDLPLYAPFQAERILSNAFFYRKSQFRPGDLLVFSGCGPVAATIKMMTSSRWTHVGIVVDVPCPWTGRMVRELFEVTEWSRLGGRRGARGAGVRILPIEERIHEAHAYAVSHVERTVPLDQNHIKALGLAALRVWAKYNHMEEMSALTTLGGTERLGDASPDIVWGAQTAAESGLVGTLLDNLCDIGPTSKGALHELHIDVRPGKTGELMDVSVVPVVKLLMAAGMSGLDKLVSAPLAALSELIKHPAFAHPVAVRLPERERAYFPDAHPFRYGEARNARANGHAERSPKLSPRARAATALGVPHAGSHAVPPPKSPRLVHRATTSAPPPAPVILQSHATPPPPGKSIYGPVPSVLSGSAPSDSPTAFHSVSAPPNIEISDLSDSEDELPNYMTMDPRMIRRGGQ